MSAKLIKRRKVQGFYIPAARPWDVFCVVSPVVCQCLWLFFFFYGIFKSIWASISVNQASPYPVKELQNKRWITQNIEHNSINTTAVTAEGKKIVILVFKRQEFLSTEAEPTTCHPSNKEQHVKCSKDNRTFFFLPCFSTMLNLLLSEGPSFFYYSPIHALKPNNLFNFPKYF